MRIRCVLVWVTFGLLYNFDAVEKWAKRREAMRATSDPCAAPHQCTCIASCYTLGAGALDPSRPQQITQISAHTAPPQKISAPLCLTD